MNKRRKILIVEDDSSRAEQIRLAFEDERYSQFDIEFRTTQQTASANIDWAGITAAVIDFSHSPQRAVAAAWKLRHAQRRLGIAVMAPPSGFLAPIELVELSLGPLIHPDEEGIESLPSLMAALTDGDETFPDHISESDLRLRNMELRDITDSLARQSVHLIRMGNELAAEKSKVETVINGMTDGMAFFDQEGQLEVANPVAYKLFPTLHPPEPISLDDFREMLDTRKSALNYASGRPGEDSFEIEIRGASFRVRNASVTDSSEQHAGSLYLFTDITRDKEYDQLKNDFTNMISHELRTPLTSIRAAVDNFIRGALGEVSDTQRKFLELIARNVNRQQSLIDDLLDLAKFEAGQMELKLERSSLKLLVEYTVEQYSLAFRDKGVALSFVPPSPDEELALYFDPQLMGQALENLLSNALKFTSRGGEVKVSLQEEPGQNHPATMLAVTDTGIGIPADKLDRIFEKYSQADTGRRRRYPGTGLGLAIVREIAQAHQGTVRVESKPGEGSCFVLTILNRNGDEK